MTVLCNARPPVSRFGRTSYALGRRERSILSHGTGSSERRYSATSAARWCSSQHKQTTGVTGTCATQWPWRYQRRQTLSTSGGAQDETKVAVATVAIAQNEILETASQEATHWSALATRSFSPDHSSKDDPSSLRDASDAIEASQALLTLTSPPKPLADAINGNQPNSEQQVTSLHRALLAVTSWCLSLVPSDASLLKLSLDLARRANELSLPLHLPLYQQLAVAVAQHSQDDSLAALILDVSSWVSTALLLPVQASFFDAPLIYLVRRWKLREAIDLLHGVKARQGIEFLDYATANELVEMLMDNVDQDIEDADALELILVLNRSLMRVLPMQKRQLGSGKPLGEDRLADDDIFEEMMDLMDQLPWDDEDENGELFDMVESILNTTVGSPNDLKAAMTDLLQKVKGKQSSALSKSSGSGEEDGVKKGVVQLDPDSGRLERMISPVADADESSDSSDEEVGDYFAKEMIYTRDSSRWKLPDVTDQLVELSKGRDTLYTSEYEEKILRDMTEEEDEDDFDL